MDEQQDLSGLPQQGQGTAQRQDQAGQDDAGTDVRSVTQGFPSFDSSSFDPIHHDLSYLEGPAPAGGQSNEPQRYFQGLANNAYILKIPKTDLLRSDAQSPFNSVISATTDHSEMPNSLRPTIIQHRYPHHPFFDCIPIPDFRDRVILAAATNPPLINRFDICYDMFAGGLIYSGDSAIEQNWQFSALFKEKWDALLHIDLNELQKLTDQSGGGV